MRHLALLVAVMSAGCLRQTEFKCAQDTDCNATGAVCETTGYCSFTDPECASGRRYGDFSGSYSNQCVGDQTVGADGGSDGATGDGMTDAPTSACPASYTTLPNAGAHVYKVIGNTASWTTQRDACAADGGYLAIPDDEGELEAITTAAAATRTWVGISDRDTEGTYVTVKGEPATFTPWAASEPDNQGGQDCVSALMVPPRIATDRCDTPFPAVCECDP